MVTLLELQEIFRDVFDNETLVITAQTNANDIEGWDSFAQIILLEAAQSRFQVKFNTREIIGLQSVGDMVHLIDSKRSLL